MSRFLSAKSCAISCAMALCLFAASVAVPTMAVSAADANGVPGPAPDGKIVGAWTQFVAPGAVPAGAPLAPPAVELRLVVQTSNTAAPIRSDAAYCADYALAYTTSGNVQAVTGQLAPRANLDKYDFPVAVCAIALDADWSHVKVIPAGGHAGDPAAFIWDETGPTQTAVSTIGPYQIGRSNVSATGKPELQVITLGDSGCRGMAGSKNPKLQQDCSSSRTWPLAKIAAQAATQYQPDAVVHVGDYRYYKDRKIFSDTWSFWLKDFVAPAQPLLLAAPWALVRGNHELCGGQAGGVGYFYLFGPRDSQRCDLNDNATWHFDIAPGGMDATGQAAAPHRFVIIDSADDNAAKAQANFETAIDVSTQASSWWATHIAPLHLLYYDSSISDSNPEIAAGLDAALRARNTPLCDSTRSPQPTCIPSTLLLGHDHMFQTVQFNDANGRFLYPQMYIVGHGGVSLRGAGLNGSPCTFRFTSMPGLGTAMQAEVATRKDFGFVAWKRSLDTVDTASGWIADPQWVSTRGAAGKATVCISQ